MGASIIITDNTTYFSVKHDVNNQDHFPLDSVILSRRNDKFRLVPTSKESAIIEFNQSEVATPAHAEVLATGSVELTGGAAGSVDSITVNGVELLSAAVNFNSTLIQTATDIAANITANTSVPNYTADSGGTTTVTITAVAGSGNTPNGFVVVSTPTTITTTDVNMSGGKSPADVLEETIEGYIFT